MKIMQFRYKNGPFSTNPNKNTKRTIIVLEDKLKSLTGFEIKPVFSCCAVRTFSKNRITKILSEVEMSLN